MRVSESRQRSTRSCALRRRHHHHHHHLITTTSSSSSSSSSRTSAHWRMEMEKYYVFCFLLVTRHAATHQYCSILDSILCCAPRLVGPRHRRLLPHLTVAAWLRPPRPVVSPACWCSCWWGLPTTNTTVVYIPLLVLLGSCTS